MDEGPGALVQLRAWLAQYQWETGARLPPERELCEILGVSRGGLRRALAVLEGEGALWRHVGKGTFVGERPADEATSIAAVAGRTNPAEIMRTRLLIEPPIAREAALNATAAHNAELRRCLDGARRATSWRHYESWDNRLHRSIAEAARNIPLLALFDTLNALRRVVVWGRLRSGPSRPPASHHSFAEHAAIVAAIAERDLEGASRAMRDHLLTVESRLLRHAHAAE